MIIKIALVVIGILIVIALSTAIWRILHDFFKNSISRLVGLVLAVLFFYVGWKLLWYSAPKDENKGAYEYIIKKYGNSSLHSGTSDSRQGLQDSSSKEP